MKPSPLGSISSLRSRPATSKVALRRGCSDGTTSCCISGRCSTSSTSTSSISSATTSVAGWPPNFAAFHPERVRSLTVIAPMGLRVADAPPMEWMAADPQRVVERSSTVSPATTPTCSRRRRTSRASSRLRRERGDRSPHLGEALRHSSSIVDSPTSTCPPHVVTPADDRIIPSVHAERWAEALRRLHADHDRRRRPRPARPRSRPGRRQRRRLHRIRPRIARPVRSTVMNRLEFYLFHLMPYPYIPAAEDMESIWITLPNGHYDPQVGHRLYHEYLDQLVLAEKLGYDGVARQRAPPDRLRRAAGAEPVGVVSRRQDRAHEDRCRRQRVAAAPQPAARRRGDRDARRVVGWPHHLRPRPGDGRRVRVGRVRSDAVEGSLLGGQRPDREGVDRGGPVPVARRALRHRARQRVASSRAEAASADLAARLHQRRDDRQRGQAALPVHADAHLELAVEVCLRPLLPGRRGAVRLHAAPAPARAPLPHPRRGDRRAGPPRGTRAHPVVLPQRAQDPGLPHDARRLQHPRLDAEDARGQGRAPAPRASPS